MEDRNEKMTLKDMTKEQNNMDQTKKEYIKTIAILATPLLLFVILFIPYQMANSAFIVDIFGCGCPKNDEYGNIIHSYFNANDFTALFWLFISMCATVISAFLSKRIPKSKMWLRIVYVVCILILSLLISYDFYQLMMWN